RTVLDQSHNDELLVVRRFVPQVSVTRVLQPFRQALRMVEFELVANEIENRVVYHELLNIDCHSYFLASISALNLERRKSWSSRSTGDKLSALFFLCAAMACSTLLRRPRQFARE